MSVNREKPHILVLPEDDANRQIATGFQLELDWPVQRNLQVLNPSGGWTRVLACFEEDHVSAMHRYPNRFMILLIDFDEDPNRLTQANGNIPPDLESRVFILGAWSEPERLKSAGLGSYEEIGSTLARACRDQTDGIWNHALLQQNAAELSRLRQHVRSILF